MEHFTVGAEDGVAILGIGEGRDNPCRLGVVCELVPKLDRHVGGVGEGLHGLDASDGPGSR